MSKKERNVFTGLQRPSGTGGSRREQGHKGSSKEEKFKPSKMLYLQPSENSKAFPGS